MNEMGAYVRAEHQESKSELYLVTDSRAEVWSYYRGLSDTIPDSLKRYDMNWVMVVKLPKNVILQLYVSNMEVKRVGWLDDPEVLFGQALITSTYINY